MTSRAAFDAPRREPWIVLALVAFAVVRVWLGASVFPFFNNVDEYRHVDTVAKYARGKLPGPGEPRIEAWSALQIAGWSSPEYLKPVAEAREGPRAIPLAQQRDPEARLRLERLTRNYVQWTSLQANAPPAYYLAAGGVLNVTQRLGLDGARALYVVRWMNVVVIGALVLAAWWGLRRDYADEALVRLGVPATLAVYPNDFQYGITNDVFLPLFGGIGFLLLVRLAADPGWRVFLAAGLALAGVVLTKFTSAALWGVALAVVGLRLFAPPRARLPASVGLRWAGFAATAILPVGAWLLRNRLVVGSFSGMDVKAERMTMTPRPISTWLDHPLAGPAGWIDFLPRLFKRFWRGELVWGGEVMTTPALDQVYIALSVAIAVLGVLAWTRRPAWTAKWRTEGLALLAVAGGIASLAQLSVSWDLVTGNFKTPWSEAPYFTAGRYISWALVPVALCLVRGIEIACAALPEGPRRRLPWLLLLAFGVFVTTTEIFLTRDVLASPYNWFHIGAAAP